MKKQLYKSIMKDLSKVIKKHINENLFDDLYDIDQETNSEIDLADQVYGDRINIYEYEDAYEKFVEFNEELMTVSEFEEYKNSTIDALNSIFKTKNNFEKFVNESIELYGELLKKGTYKYSYEYEELDEYYEMVSKKCNEKLNIKYNLNITDDEFELLFEKGGFVWCVCEYGL